MRVVPLWKYITVLFVSALAIAFLWPTVQWYSRPLSWRLAFNAKHVEQLPELADLIAERDQLRSATDTELNQDRLSEIEDEINDFVERWRARRDRAIQLGLDLSGGTRVQIEVRRPPHVPEKDYNEEEAVALTLQRLRDRIDQYGVAESNITTMGKNMLLIEVPGSSVPAVTDTAQLQLCLLKEPGDKDDLQKTIERITRNTGIQLTRYVQTIQGSGQYQVNKEDRERVARAVMPPHENSPEEHKEMYRRVKPHIPEGYRFLFGVREGDPKVREWYPLYLVKEREELSGERLKNAQVAFGPLNEPYVLMTFDADGAKKFRNVTAKNVGRRLAIVMDDTVYSAPVIQQRIAGGSAQITGNFSVDEARRLAVVLASGRLPADIRLVEQRFIGPELGQDSIRRGFTSVAYTTVLTIAFMIAYYSVAGVVANLALIFGLFLLLGVLGMFGAALTLPGLAGLALTIGMAVDANVLIYERMREELRNRNIAPGTLVDKAYNRAYSAIIDGNLTTMIVGVLLVAYGSWAAKAIQGFGTTLTLGIFVTMFSALFCTRIVFDLLSKRPKAKHVPVGRFRIFENTNYDFMSMRNYAFIGSGVVIVVTWIYMAIVGLHLGVDFEGGSLLRMTFPPDVKIEQVRQALASKGFPSSQVQEVRGERNMMQIRVSQRELGKADIDESVSVGKLLQQVWPAATIDDEESVGAKVGADLLGKAVSLIGVSCLLIIVYVWIRFQFWFGIAAVVALWHDVMISLGVFNAMGRETNLPVVAGLLTIVGYSLNDTIVVFDRIRENMRAGTMRFTELINRSINETLSRTAITGVTTFVAAVALYLLGGPAIQDFALVLIIGMVVGTYSSIFIASPLLVIYHQYKQSRQKETEHSA